jgi:FMN phosphatase YigB (HAD superfamily)
VVTGTIETTRVKAVIFDMMHTLFNRGTRLQEAEFWTELINMQLGTTLEPAKVLEAVRRQEVDAGVGKTQFEEWIDSIFTELGVQVNREQADGLAFALGRITLLCGWPYPGIKNLIHDIRTTGRKVGILSTIGYQGRMVATALELQEPLVDMAAFSNEIGLTKDFDDYQDQAYRLACKKIGFKPEEVLFVDDRIDYVETAHGIGMQGVVVLHPGGFTHELIEAEHTTREKLDAEGIPVIDEIDELRQLLKLPAPQPAQA